MWCSQYGIIRSVFLFLFQFRGFSLCFFFFLLLPSFGIVDWCIMCSVSLHSPTLLILFLYQFQHADQFLFIFSLFKEKMDEKQSHVHTLTHPEYIIVAVCKTCIAKIIKLFFFLASFNFV